MARTLEEIDAALRVVEAAMINISEALDRLPNTYCARLTFNNMDTVREGQIMDLELRIDELSNEIDVIREALP